MTGVLDIFLNDRRAGVLTLLPEGRILFSFDESYAEDHASYIAHWLEVLQNDNRAIFRAAAHAQRAADHLHGLQPSAMGEAA